MARWATDAAGLARFQEELARAAPPAWAPPPGRLVVGGCYACFARGVTGAGTAGDPGVAGAAVTRGRRLLASATAAGPAGASYQAALLALREGALLEAAVRALPLRPDVLLVNATGRDHPRRAGLALHLGAVLDLPTVGVTDRPLLAEGGLPPDIGGATAPLLLEGEPVGCWLRARQGVRPVAVHAAWRTDVETAVAVVLAATRRPARTPEPLRRARTAARVARRPGSYLPFGIDWLGLVQGCRCARRWPRPPLCLRRTLGCSPCALAQAARPGEQAVDS